MGVSHGSGGFKFLDHLNGAAKFSCRFHHCSFVEQEGIFYLMKLYRNKEPWVDARITEVPSCIPFLPLIETGTATDTLLFTQWYAGKRVGKGELKDGVAATGCAVNGYYCLLFCE